MSVTERHPDDGHCDRTVAVVGGTGPQGRGLAYRFALAGYPVILGSRDAGPAQEQAGDVNAKPRVPRVSGSTNADAVQRSDLVLLAVPWEGHADLVASLADELAEKVVIS